MTQEVLKLALEALEGLIKKTSGQAIYSFMETERRIAMSACVGIKEALREHAMREVQRLGQEIEQEPIGTVKELFTQTAWETLDLRGSTKVYLNTTPPQRGKEPVKYSDYEPDGVHHNKPPQCTWVDLTSEEYNEIWCMDLNNKDIMDKTISKLKEKNT